MLPRWLDSTTALEALYLVLLVGRLRLASPHYQPIVKLNNIYCTKVSVWLEVAVIIVVGVAVLLFVVTIHTFGFKSLLSFRNSKALKDSLIPFLLT